MEVMSWYQVLELAVKAKGKAAVYVQFGSLKDDPEVENYLWEALDKKFENQRSLFGRIMSTIPNGGLFFFDTDEERDDFFKIFNVPPVYASGVYACTYDANGKCLTENT